MSESSHAALIIWVHSAIVTWKFSIDGEEVRLLYGAAHRFQSVLKIYSKRENAHQQPAATLAEQRAWKHRGSAS